MKFRIIKNDKTTNRYVIPSNDHINEHFLFLDDVNKGSKILQYAELGYMIISASRNTFTDEENLKRAKNLENDLISYGLGYRPSIGGYIEDLNDGEGVKVTELSYVVPKLKDMSDEEFLEIALKLGSKYNQETILISLPSVNNGNPSYIKPNGETDMEFKRLKFSREEEPYYTELRKKGTEKFVLTNDSITKRSVTGKTYTFVPANVTHQEISDCLEKYCIVPWPMYDVDAKELKEHYKHGEFLPGFKGRFLRYHE